MGGRHQTWILGDLKWLLLSDLWVEILSQVTALAFPERISLLLSSAQPFLELLGGGLQSPQPLGCSFSSYPSLACSFNRESFTPPQIHGLCSKPQALLPQTAMESSQIQPWLASGHPTIISLLSSFRVQGGLAGVRVPSLSLTSSANLDQDYGTTRVLYFLPLNLSAMFPW